MPAPRGSKQSLVEHLATQAKAQPVNNILSLSKYFRSADLLISQAHLYRAAHNDEQLYVMLMRFASLVVETIPKHKDYRKNDGQYVRLKKLLVDDYLGELEKLKLVLRTKDPVSTSRNRPPEAVQVQQSTPPQLTGASGSLSSADSGSGLLTQQPIVLTTSTWSSGDPTDLLSGPIISATPSAPALFSSQPQSTYQPTYTHTTQQSRERHQLYSSRTSGATRSYTSPLSAIRPRYPIVDTTPSAPAADLLSFNESSIPVPDPSAPALTPVEVTLLDAPPLIHPSAGPTLGPQEVQVHNVDPSMVPLGTCSGPCVPPSETAITAPEGGVKALTRRTELRDVHISVALVEDFLQFAIYNTKRGIETCGILAGKLNGDDSIFTVTTLIIPKQEGTTDTVTTLNEEEVAEVQITQEIYPLGWIHTHPTQSCFMSSVDVHTQCGYQTMLDEAIAIVMAPTDRRRKCDMFRLSTPGGLSLIQKCELRGFHTHPPTHTGQEVYEQTGHAYWNPRVKHEVIDLR